MILDKVELHNIDEVRKDESGWQLQRVPSSVSQYLSPMGYERILSPANSEIRCTMLDEDPVRIKLSSVSGKTIVVPFVGDHREGPILHIDKEPQVLEFKSRPRFVKGRDALPDTCMFSPRVLRLMLWGGQVRFHEIEGNVRPPVAAELPKRRYLAYGTSITHGGEASAPHLNYAAQTAWRLGADLLNFGVGGSCFCEPEFADYLAARKDWDFATLEISINMLGTFTPEEFGNRATYVVNTIAGANTARPVACITPILHLNDLVPSEIQDKLSAYRRVLREVAAASPHPNVHLFEGPDILTSFSGLSADMVHPSDLGMIAMGEQLAKRLAPLL